MATIYSTSPLFPDLVCRMEASGHSVVVNERWPDLATLEVADALISLLSNVVDAQMIEAHGTRLQVIANVAVGFENVDLNAARAAGILVTNTPDVLTESTADHAFALLLSCARRIAESDAAVRRGEFPAWGLDQAFTGLDIHGKTLGIIGMGRIGTAVARRGRLGFGMRVVYNTRTRKPEVEQELGAEWLSMENLLACSDFVVLLVPLTSETRHLIDRERLGLMKRTGILVNVSRGAVVDETALAVALREGRIAGAGLDVFEQEPKVHPDLLGLHEHVTLSPHIASATHETRYAMAQLAVENVLAVLEGKPPLTPVPPSLRSSGRVCD